MKHFVCLIVFVFLTLNCFPQLNVVDSSNTSTTNFNSQSNTIKLSLPFTAFAGKNNLVDDYLCYNGNYYYLLANKTSNPSDKSVTFILGTTKESSIQTLLDLRHWMSKNPIKSSITVVMGGKKHTIVKTDEDLMSFTSADITGIWLLDTNQISYCIDNLTTNTFSHPYRTSPATISTPKLDQSNMYKGRGGTGSGTGSGSGIGSGTGSGLGPSSGSGSSTGSGLGPGEGGGHGGGIGYGTGTRGMVNSINTSLNEEGQVCVEVHVTAEGNVISARVINTSKFKTTIMNSSIQAQCIAQAKQARYKPGKEELRVIIFH